MLRAHAFVLHHMAAVLALSALHMAAVLTLFGVVEDFLGVVTLFRVIAEVHFGLVGSASVAVLAARMVHLMALHGCLLLGVLAVGEAVDTLQIADRQNGDTGGSGARLDVNLNVLGGAGVVPGRDQAGYGHGVLALNQAGGGDAGGQFVSSRGGADAQGAARAPAGRDVDVDVRDLALGRDHDGSGRSSRGLRNGRRLRHLNKTDVLRAAAAADTGESASAVALQDVARQNRPREDSR